MEPSSRNKQLKRTLPIALSLAVLLLLFFHRPLTITWYEMLMRSSQQKVYTNSPPSVADVLIYRIYGLRSSEPEDMYVLCRDKLIKLRYLSRRAFRLKHVGKNRGDYRAFQNLARATFPNAVEAGLVRYSQSQPPMFEVCDYSDRLTEWSEFLDRYDVPKFQQVLARDRERLAQ